MYNIKTFVLQQQNSKLKRTQLRRKVYIKESEFLRNMHIHTLCSKYFQTFMKCYSVVKAMDAMKIRLFYNKIKLFLLKKNVESYRISFTTMYCKINDSNIKEISIICNK